MINTQTLKGNLIMQDYSTAFILNQGDKGVPFRVELLENGTPYTLLSDDIVTIEWLKPNGNPFLQEGDIKYGTNYIEFTTPESVAQYSGSGSFNIIISNSDVRKGTIRREYKVVPTSMKPGSVSEDTITDAITELRELSVEIADTVQNNQDLINNNQAATKQDIANVNSSLEEKASKTDVQAANARIDTFTSLADGSTTGDAELIDGRTGADGITYTNIGGAIRGQYNVLKESLIKTNENLKNQFGYSLEYDITWIENEGYDTSTGIAESNTNVRRTDLINFSEMFNKLGGSVEYKNVTSKMLVLLFHSDKTFDSTVNLEWLLNVTDISKLPTNITYFAVMEEKTENFRIVTTKKEINDIKSIKNDVSSLKNTPHMLISYFEAENTNGVHLGISYDGVNFDKIGKVFENDETRDPCIIKHNNVYYLIYSHWGEFKKMNVPIYKSSDLMNWELHSTIPIDLSSFGSGYDEIWAPEFYKDNNGTLCLTFGSRITSTGVVNGFVGIMNNEITTIINIGQIHIPNITDTFDVSFYNDNGTYYAVCHSETFGTLKETFVYKSSNLFGEYTKVSKLPAENYNEGLCIEKVGDTFYIYADEKVSENENPDRRHLVLYTSKDMLTFDRIVCGTNFRHAKIIKADEIDMARLERAMIVKKYLKQ